MGMATVLRCSNVTSNSAINRLFFFVAYMSFTFPVCETMAGVPCRAIAMKMTMPSCVSTTSRSLQLQSWCSTTTTKALLFLLLLLLLFPAAMVHARVILGFDLGSLYMKVALVQSVSPLEIVTNLHSKCKTEQMILFDHQQHFYGADASALLARKSHLTPAVMLVLLGRDEQHPVMQVRKKERVMTII